MLEKLRNLVVVVIFSMFIIAPLFHQENVTALPVGWSDDIRLTNAPDYRDKPCIGIDGNNIYVVWDDARGGVAYDDYEIYFKKSTDNGKTWSDDKRLSNALHYSLNPKIAINSSNIHIIWMDDREAGWDIYYNQSEDCGETWLGEKRISPDPFTSECDKPDIAVDVGYVHIVYPDSSDVPDSDCQLYYINSSDNGITWSPRQRLTSLIRDSNDPSIAVDSNNIHIVWMDHYDRFGIGTMGAIFYMNSSDGGLTWSEDINLTPMNLDASLPDIGINGDKIHVIFGEQRDGIWQIHYRRSEDKGKTWTDDITLSNSTEDVKSSAIALNNNEVHVVWYDERDGNREIYYKYSLDNGKNWSDDIRLTYDSAQSCTQDIAVNNIVHVVFADDRIGNPQIYYKYYPFYPPPTNLTIDIWGTNITLNWTTPQIGLSPVDYYLVYRVTDSDSFTFSESEIIYNSSGTGNDLLTTWNDTTALLDESNNYYYVVRAVYENGEIDSNENIVGKFVIPLNRGWNLFSLPLVQDNSSVSEVLKSIDGNYDVIWIYDAKEARWRSSTSDLTDINRTMGLWIHMKNTCNLSVVGAVPDSSDITLYEGWNLVGYPSLKTRNLNDVLSGITWQAVQYYNAFDANDPWKHNSTNKPDNLNDLKEMKPGRGYWIYITINDTWTTTRMSEDNKAVVWRVYGLEGQIDDQGDYETITHNPIDTDEDIYNQIDVVPEQPINKNKDGRLDFTFFPLIILIALVFAEIISLHKRRR